MISYKSETMGLLISKIVVFEFKITTYFWNWQFHIILLRTISTPRAAVLGPASRARRACRASWRDRKRTSRGLAPGDRGRGSGEGRTAVRNRRGRTLAKLARGRMHFMQNFRNFRKIENDDLLHLHTRDICIIGRPGSSAEMIFRTFPVTSCRGSSQR